MLITKLKLNYFGKFHNREIELKPGINLIYGVNEAGKSTIHSFIKGMLFGIERLRGRGSASKEDIYTRYLPWDYPGAYNGSMDIQIGEKQYRLLRSFHANDKYFSVLDLSTGREVKLNEGLISELIPGLTESAYKNTVSIEQQKTQTDATLAAEVRNYIANLSIAKSKEINVAKAVSILTDQRKQLEAFQNTALLKELQAQIEEGIKKEEEIEQLTIQLRQLLAREQELIKQKDIILNNTDNKDAEQMEQLPAILEKYKSYRELNKKEDILIEQLKDLEDKITALQKEQFSCDVLQVDIVKLKDLQNRQMEQDKLELELKTEVNRLNNEDMKKLIISVLPGVIVAPYAVIVMHFKPIGILMALLVIASWSFYFILSKKKYSKRQSTLKDEYSTLIQEKSAVQENINQIFRKYGASRMEDIFSKQEQAIRRAYDLEHAIIQKEELNNRQKELEDTKDILYDAIMKYMQYFITEEDLTDAAMQNLQRIIADRKKETSGKLSQLNAEHESCKLNIEKLRWKITALEGNEEELLRNKVKFLELEHKQKENAVELEAVKLALTSITQLSADIHDSFGQQLNDAVSDVIGKVTGQKYTDLKVDEKLEVKVGWNQDYVLLDRLSAGTIDQVYFALRMAVADLLLGKDEVVILDESFAFYDEMRVKEALSELSRRKQVILFTCHKREQIILGEMMVPYHFVDLSCG